MKVLSVNKKKNQVYYNSTSEHKLRSHLALNNPKDIKSIKEKKITIWHNYQIILIHHKVQGFTHVKLPDLYGNKKLEINTEIDRSIEEIHNISNEEDYSL